MYVRVWMDATHAEHLNECGGVLSHACDVVSSVCEGISGTRRLTKECRRVRASTAR